MNAAASPHAGHPDAMILDAWDQYRADYVAFNAPAEASHQKLLDAEMTAIEQLLCRAEPVTTRGVEALVWFHLLREGEREEALSENIDAVAAPAPCALVPAIRALRAMEASI